MPDDVLVALTFIAALGSGLVAGFFFAFSFCVMKALDRLPAPHGASAMQSINIVVINPWFMTLFFGTALVCAVLTASALVRSDRPGWIYLLSGSLLYLAGSILVTILFNVPRNNALEAVDPNSSEGAARWADYVPSWTAWNHVRTAASLAAAVLFTVALR